jgi:glucan-binding YG repeat protein
MESVSKLQQIIADLQAAERRLVASSTDLTTNSASTNAFQGASVSNHNTYAFSKADCDKLLEKISELEEKNTQLHSEIISLTDENRRFAQELYDAQKESILKTKNNELLINEQEIIISKLHQVQEELESYYVDKITLEAVLKDSTSFFNDVRTSIMDKVDQTN